MNSRVIKCVAGAGKNRWSKDYIKSNGNGLYLAFTNSVVDELSSCGVISRTYRFTFYRVSFAEACFHYSVDRKRIKY